MQRLPLYKRAVAICEKSLGTDHPITVTVRETGKMPPDTKVEMTVSRDKKLMQFALKRGRIGVQIRTAGIPKKKYDLILKQLGDSDKGTGRK